MAGAPDAYGVDVAGDGGVPGDEVLVVAAGWGDVPSVRVLAKDGTDDFCVAVVDVNGGLGARAYETVELFARAEDGTWGSTGDLGPAAGGGSGWTDGHFFTYGRSTEPHVRVVVGERWHEIVTQVDGWYAFAVRVDGLSVW